MAKDYLTMIADIQERFIDNETNEIRGKSLVTPASILAASRYGSLTRGGLRDAFRFATGCSWSEALICIDVAVEARIIVIDEDGLYRVRQ